MSVRRPYGNPKGRWRGSFGLAALIAIYIFVNALIWIAAEPGVRLAKAADGQSWYHPAIALMKHGGFVLLDDPQRADTYRPPLYPLFEAAAMTVAGGEAPEAIAIAQIILLLLCGLLFRDTVRDWLPGWENLGFTLLVLNPNVLSTAQFVQSEILFLAFVTLAFWAAARYARGHGGWGVVLVTGLGVALACLTRPTAQFLLFTLPLLFPLLAIAGAAAGVRRAFVQGLSTLLLALAVIAPWAWFVASEGHGLALSANEGKYRYVWDQVTMIEALSNDISYHEADKRLTSPGGKEHAFIESQGEAWKSLSATERHKALADAGMNVLLSYPVSDFAKTLYRSQAQFYFAGGAGNWHNLFGIGSESVSQAWFSSAQADVWALLKRLFADVPPSGLVLSAIALGFAVTARLIGLIGVFALMRDMRWGLLLIISGIVLYFAFIHVFVGNSRYRVSVEPMLMFLVLAGLDQITQILGRR